MKLYFKKPLPVEVVQYDGTNAHDIHKWSGGKVYQEVAGEGTMKIKTLEGVMDCIPFSYVVKGPFGEFWAVRNDIFEATYEEVK